MTVSLLIDSDVIIDIQREYKPAVTWYSTLSAGYAGLPGFVALELIQNARNKREAEAADAIIRPLPTVWPEARGFEWALANFARFYLSHNIGLLDMLIAATAMTASLPLATFNTKHFGPIPGLVTIQPYAK